MTENQQWLCCPEHRRFPRYLCQARKMAAVQEACERFADPLERLLYVTERLGGIDRYDWSEIARNLR